MIENKPNYILTQDSVGLFSKVNSKDLSVNRKFIEAAEIYFNRIEEVLSVFLQPDTDVVSYTESEMNRRLTERITAEFKANPDNICICLDRFLLEDLEKDNQYKDRLFRFSICRTILGERVPRQMGKSFSEQINQIKAAVPGIERRKVIVIDDGIFSGGTVREFLEIATQNGVKISISKIIGFIGNEEINFDNSFPAVGIIEPVKNLYEWIDIRDFSPMGGKKLAASRNNKVTSSVPYLYPWSEGEGASLNLSPRLFIDSSELIIAFRDLVTKYEESTGSSNLTFRILIKSGFPLPTDIGKTIPISINDTVTGYLDRCLELIKKEQERTVYVFDMDGTLYQLDGVDNGFRSSKLEKAIVERAILFIRARENCTMKEAETVFQEAVQDTVGASAFLSKRYGISRTDYFDEVWNIDPADILRNYESAAQSIKILKQQYPDRKYILLTSAPGIWAEKVLEFLSIRDCFEKIYTGEQYGSKNEIFRLLAGRYRPENILSIGDQMDTDIEPAKIYGIKTLLITDPSQLIILT